MTEVTRVRRLVPWLVALGVAAAPGPAAAVGDVKRPGTRPDSFAGLVADLQQGGQPDRRFAARSLRGMIRTWVRQSSRLGGDATVRDEARGQLEACDEEVAPVCLRSLGRPEMTRACADILVMLETPGADEALTEALETEERAGARRHLERARGRLQALNP